MNGIFSQRVGKILTSPNKIIMLPEIICQTSAGTEIKNVLNLSKSVKIIIDKPSETAMVNAFILFLLFSSPVTEEPIITGKSGNVHGARMVRTPAINEMSKKNIIVYSI